MPERDPGAKAAKAEQEARKDWNVQMEGLALAQRERERRWADTEGCWHPDGGGGGS